MVTGSGAWRCAETFPSSSRAAPLPSSSPTPRPPTHPSPTPSQRPPPTPRPRPLRPRMPASMLHRPRSTRDGPIPTASRRRAATGRPACARRVGRTRTPIGPTHAATRIRTRAWSGAICRTGTARRARTRARAETCTTASTSIGAAREDAHPAGRHDCWRAPDDVRAARDCRCLHRHCARLHRRCHVQCVPPLRRCVVPGGIPSRVQGRGARTVIRSALAYASGGFAVLPLEPRGKRPLTRRGVYDATTEPWYLHHWWDRWPDANVGLAIRPDWLVIDVDVRSGGNDTIALWPSMPITPTQITSTGGLHFILKRPPGELKGKAAKGIDVLARGRFIVTAPSVRELGRYKWIRKLSSTPIAE